MTREQGEIVHNKNPYSLPGFEPRSTHSLYRDLNLWLRGLDLRLLDQRAVNEL
jgi:hypothetical protein